MRSTFDISASRVSLRECHLTLFWYNRRMHWSGRARLLVLTLICLFWTGLIFFGYFFPSAPFISAPWRAEQSFEDLLRREGRKTKSRGGVVFRRSHQSRATELCLEMS